MASTSIPYHKLVVLGAGGVGKTALVIQLVVGAFVAEYDPTIEDSYKKKVHIDHEPCMIDILDTAGQEEYSAMREEYMKTGEGFVLVYSVLSRTSFEDVQIFYEQIMRVRAAQSTGPNSILRSPIICLVANKADSEGERTVSTSEGFALAKSSGALRLMLQQRLAYGHSEKQSIMDAVEEFRKEANFKSVPGGRRASLLSFFSWSRSSTPRPQHKARAPLSIVPQAAVDQLLVQAARRDDKKTVKQLLDMGADPDSPSVLDGSALYATVSVGHEQMVRLLLKNKASVNALGLADQSCLHAASLEGHTTLIELLIDCGAHIEAQSEKYGTPLLAAAARGQVGAVRTLLQHRANVNATGGIYGNALQAAAWIGNVEIAQILLNSGINLHARGKGNSTALQIACWAGKHEVVRLLLLHIHDSKGKYGSPLRAASANSHFDVMKLLFEFGAKEEDLANDVHNMPEHSHVQSDGSNHKRSQSTPMSVTPNPPELASQTTRLPDDPVRAVRDKSNQWLNRIAESDFNRDVVLAYSSKRGSIKAERVKVAVLDTGYDPDASFFDRPRTDRIKGWKDWADGSEISVDESGHGTHVVSLLMKVAPYADVYVARVARNVDGLGGAGESIAKRRQAILWAATEWRVDMISMSFGFDKEIIVNGEPVISNAINEAVLKRWGYILFFAAVANYGGNQKEMFPACHHSVIPIRGTNALGVFQDYNPPPDPNGPAVFGTLGVEVPAAWLSTHDGLAYKSGTSVATPIAAGIAAMVLSCASLSYADRVPSTPNPLRHLWMKGGMLSAFHYISTCMEPRCFYMSPWTFIQKSDEERKALLIVATANAR
ncbi:uncharacterized protein LTR77_007385 [Saxophila tyrrhenica]|uniref:Peptidase S8/S53 domain-containing protein n=1 Tax=Saxophila tyrrhenica TaxID=1690608 RepID=A0AAV9P4M2_9PEZI|nr:hypothetical protein LTR77_007385 [Saxophila tyrrhenica]